MFQSEAFASQFQIQHSHGGGQWENMEEVTPAHDAAGSDPERSWQSGRIFRCKSCNEEFRIADPNESAFADQPVQP